MANVHAENVLFISTGVDGIPHRAWLPKDPQNIEGTLRPVTAETMIRDVVASFALEPERYLQRFLDEPQSYVGDLFDYTLGRNPNENFLVCDVANLVLRSVSTLHDVVENHRLILKEQAW